MYTESVCYSYRPLKIFPFVTQFCEGFISCFIRLETETNSRVIFRSSFTLHGTLLSYLDKVGCSFDTVDKICFIFYIFSWTRLSYIDMTKS
jgi:hypothetical protein